MNKLRKSVGLLFPAMRISFALAMLTACILLGAEMVGFTPDEDKLRLDARKQVSESLAIQFATLDWLPSVIPVFSRPEFVKNQDCSFSNPHNMISYGRDLQVTSRLRPMYWYHCCKKGSCGATSNYASMRLKAIHSLVLSKRVFSS
jgi:hypothetical protein